jgi:hypothetical protein
MSSYTSTYTLTFGDCAENHKGMQIIGNEVASGFSKDELLKAKENFTNLGCKCEFVDLNDLLSDNLPDTSVTDDAYILIIKNGCEAFGVDPDELYKEHEKLEKDTKAFMYGRVVNKKARHNLCFSDFEQKPDYANGKGTVYDFKNIELTNTIRNKLPEVTGTNKARNLQCEGNYYYDVKSTYIGYHGDSERRVVVAARLGADFPLYYQWYWKGDAVGKRYKVVLSHGDMYIMSDKAVGHDWKRNSIYTLRHAAGWCLK